MFFKPEKKDFWEGVHDVPSDWKSEQLVEILDDDELQDLWDLLVCFDKERFASLTDTFHKKLENWYDELDNDQVADWAFKEGDGFDDY